MYWEGRKIKKVFFRVFGATFYQMQHKPLTHSIIRLVGCCSNILPTSYQHPTSILWISN